MNQVLRFTYSVDHELKIYIVDSVMLTDAKVDMFDTKMLVR